MIREHLVTNPSMIGTAIPDVNTVGQNVASGAALNSKTASMPHALGKDNTEDSRHIQHDAHAIATARKAHAAERSIAAQQPEHPDNHTVDVLTGGASPSGDNTLERRVNERRSVYYDGHGDLRHVDDESLVNPTPNANADNGSAATVVADDSTRNLDKSLDETTEAGADGAAVRERGTADGERFDV